MAAVKTTIAPRSLLVIGGGIGGYTAAIRAARAGLRVTLVEASTELGGTCLNVGCIPTKSLLQQAHDFRRLSASRAFGIKPGMLKLDYAAVAAQKDAVVRQLVQGVQQLVRRNGIEWVRGTAEFTAPDSVRVREDGRTLRADRILIATGSKPVMPPIPGVDLPGVVSSDGALALQQLPRRVAVIGGGVIGIEFAQVFSDFGSEVTVIEQLPQLLSGEDREIVAVLHKRLSAAGVRFHLDTRVQAIRHEAGALRVEPEGALPALPADLVLVATGRAPNTQGLGLEQAGVRTERGAVATDAFCRTSQPHVYAVGDLRGGALLAHKAGAEAEAAVADMLGQSMPIDALAMPRAVYTAPELAAVGLTEEEARVRHGSIKIGRFPFSANGKALSMGEAHGLVKVIADGATDQVVGICMAGPDVANLLGEATLAVQMELTLDALAQTVHAHPTLTEALMEAAHDAQGGGAIHLPPRAAASAARQAQAA